MKRLFFLFIGLISFLAARSQATDLFISEYVEGSGNEKYIEIYNGTGVTVNLADYQLQLFSNGNPGPAPSITLTLSGTLADGAVIVVANGAATLYSPPDIASGVCSFNGDDAIALYKISTSSFVDIFGQIGCDPGSSWNDGTNYTVDKTLVRNSSVCSGITTNPGGTCSSNSFPTLSTEWTQFPSNTVSNLGSHTATCGTCPTATEPTSNASAISFSFVDCNAMNVSWTNGNGTYRIVMVKQGSSVTFIPSDNATYSADTIFGNGSEPAPGEFVAYAGTGNSFTLAGLTNNSTYYITVYEFNGAGCPTASQNYLATGAPSASQTTLTCNCPYLSGVIINSCDGTCSEGDNEIVFLNSGGYSIPVTPSNIKVYYGNSNPAATCYTDGFTSNPTYVNTLNATAGCGTLFYDALTAGTIPPNSSILLMSPTACYNYDFSAFCGQPAIYILFTNDANWSASGNFANSPSCSGGTRYFRTDFSAIAPGCITDYNYSCAGLSGTDGDYVTWSPAGGNPSAYIDEDCSFNSSTVLPLTLLSFSAEYISGQALTKWRTIEEINTSHFEILRSHDATDFKHVGTVFARGEGTQNENVYHFADTHPGSGTVYYRLAMIDKDGSTAYSEPVPVKIHHDQAMNAWYSNELITIQAAAGSSYVITDSRGTRVMTGITTGILTTLNPKPFAAGIYFLSIQNSDEIETVKLFIPSNR